MAVTKPLTTILSTKGQVILPKAIRQRRDWRPGVRLLVEDTPEGVLLKAGPFFAPTLAEDVFASLPHQGAALTLAQMDEAIVAEASRRRARD